MKLFRNKGFFRLFLLTALLFAVLFIVVIQKGRWAGAAVLLTGLAVLLLIYIDSAGRYNEMERLNKELEGILHDDNKYLITECEEGELGILISTIRKLTVRLKEQNSLLKGEKQVLNDAIADIFHQLRTPLTSLRLSCSMLSEEDIEYEERLRFVRGIKKQLERMQWLVETLLKMSKIEAGTVIFRNEAVNVNEAVQKACEPLLIPMELRNINLVTEVGGESLKGDPDWLSEALGNLVKNCMEHTPEGGTITVRAEETPLYTEIRVSDTGTGFVPEDIPRLFERFYKGKNSGKESVGIGLALCRTIINEMNGTIKAENNLEGGASFITRFYKNII